MTALTTAKILACCALSYLCVTAGIVVWRAGNALDANLAKWGDGGAQAFAGLNAALDNLNRPCSPGPCGLLPNGTKTETKISDAIVQTQLVERATTPHVTAAMDQFGMAAQHLSGTADSLKGTADALTGTANAATATIQTAGTTIAAFQPVLGHLDASSADLDAFLKGKMLTKTLPDIAMNFDTATGNFAATTADVRSQVYKWTHPSKKKLTFWTATEAGGDYARHFMPSLF